MCSWLWVSGMFNIGRGSGSTAGGVSSSSLVISPAEFLSLTAFSICSTPSGVKQSVTPLFLHTCTIMIIIVIMTITMINSINVVVCTGFSELMIIMRCVK